LCQCSNVLLHTINCSRSEHLTVRYLGALICLTECLGDGFKCLVICGTVRKSLYRRLQPTTLSCLLVKLAQQWVHQPIHRTSSHRNLPTTHHTPPPQVTAHSTMVVNSLAADITYYFSPTPTSINTGQESPRFPPLPRVLPASFLSRPCRRRQLPRPLPFVGGWGGRTVLWCVFSTTPLNTVQDRSGGFFLLISPAFSPIISGSASLSYISSCFPPSALCQKNLP